MFRPYEFFIALRYLRSRNRNRFVSFIAAISVVGIALAVAVLIVVLSVMNGFESEVRNRILAVVAHGTITGMDGRLSDWQRIAEIGAADPEVLSTAPFVRGQAMLLSETAVAGIELRGIEPTAEALTTGAGQLVREGALTDLQPGEWKIVLGHELARRLDVGIGDRLLLLTPQGSITPAGLMPRMRRFEVIGLFNAGMYEYDRGLAYVQIDDAARLMRMGQAVSGVNMAVGNPLLAGQTVQRVAMSYGGGVYVSDWTRQHANFFRSIELTKSIIFVILFLVVAVAAFNIVSTLVMVVREKRAEIAILRSMGASARSVLWIFMAEGTLIGLLGALAGTTAGVLLSYNIGAIVGGIEALLQVRFVAPDVYFISELPARLDWGDVARVSVTAFVLAVLATVYPALRGAATNPATELRHE